MSAGVADRDVPCRPPSGICQNGGNRNGGRSEHLSTAFRASIRTNWPYWPRRLEIDDTRYTGPLHPW